jgi:hypothetical protein
VSTCAGTSQCETPPAGYTSVAPYCANLTSDPNNCGGCAYTDTVDSPYKSYICGSLETCQQTGPSTYQCTSTCPTGASICTGTTSVPNDGNPTTPYCANLQTDALNCTSCDHVCATGQFCSAGTCSNTCANTSKSTYCASPSPHCADLTLSDQDCGACGAGCGGQCLPNDLGPPAAPGVCCGTGQSVCSGACKSLQTDSSNCGSCGYSCGGQTCRNGVCGGYHWVQISNSSCGDAECQGASGSYAGCNPASGGSGPFTCNSSSVGNAFLYFGSGTPATPTATDGFGFVFDYYDNAGQHAFPSWTASGTACSGTFAIWECVFD